MDHSGCVRVFSEGVPASETLDEVRLRESAGLTGDAPARQLARYVDQMAARYVPGFDVRLMFRRDRFLRGGDHLAFSEQGYPAIRFTEFEEDYDHQHQTPRVERGRVFGDDPRFCDFEYVANVARVNLAALAALARAPAPPANLRMITAQLSNDTTLRWDAATEGDLAGYRVVWRETTSPNWQHAQELGAVTGVTLPLSKDNVIFGVQSFDEAGHASTVAIPAPAKE